MNNKNNYDTEDIICENKNETINDKSSLLPTLADDKYEKIKHKVFEIKKLVGCIFLILSVALFVLAIFSLTNKQYRFFIENRADYVKLYEDASRTAVDNDYAPLQSSFDRIADIDKDLLEKCDNGIKKYRTIATTLFGAGALTSVVGFILLINKKKHVAIAAASSD